jgi:MATE family multidrug resistance protein
MTAPSHRPSLLSLASPMIVSRAGLAGMALTDCVMVARFNAHQLAFTTLAEGTFGRLVDVCLAFLLSGLVLIAAAHAKSEAEDKLVLWRRSLLVSLGLGAVCLMVSQFGAPVLTAMGQGRDLAKGGGAVIGALGWGIPAGLIAVASAVYLEGVRRPVYVAVCVIAANLLNLAINWLLIGGHAGFPAMGALGSAISTSLVRVALAAALVGSVLAVEGRGVLQRLLTLKAQAKDQWRLGLSASATAGGMHALAIWLTVFAGWLGGLSVAAYASCWMLNMPGMLLAMGLSDAIAMRVAQDDGKTRWTTARQDLFTLALALSPFDLVLVIAPGLIAGLYTQDQGLRVMMAALLPWSGLALMLDGLSMGVAAALRGRRDVTAPTMIQLVSMGLTPVLAALFAFGLHLGVGGMVLAIVITSTLRLALLSLRAFAPARTPAPRLERRSAWG